MKTSPPVRFARYEDAVSSFHAIGLSCTGFGFHADVRGACGPRLLDCYAAVWVERGSGQLETAATDGTQKVRAGDLFWLFPGVSHCYGPDEAGWSERWVLFGGDQVRAFERTGLLRRHQPLVQFNDAVTIGKLFDDLAADFAQPAPFSGLLGAATVHRLIAVVHTFASETRLERSDEKRRRVVQTIKSSALGNLDLPVMTREAGVGASTLRRWVKQATGASPKTLIMARRFSKAKELLVNTALPVAEVAARVGYHDPLYFSRQFKQREHLSPTVFRQRERRAGHELFQPRLARESDECQRSDRRVLEDSEENSLGPNAI